MNEAQLKVEHARQEAQRRVDRQPQKADDALVLIEQARTQPHQHHDDDVEDNEWWEEACGVCADAVRECRVMRAMLAARARQGRAAVDVADTDDEIAAWRRALPQMEPLERLRLTEELAQVRGEVLATAQSAALAGMPEAVAAVCGRMRALLNDVAHDAEERGKQNSGVMKAVELARREVDLLEHSLDFEGCLRRVDELVLEAAGGHSIEQSAQEQH